MKIIVLGAGTWGTTLAKVLDENSHSVTLWHYKKSFVNFLKEKQYHPKLKINLKNSISITTNINEIKNNSLVVIAVPTQSIRKVLSLVDFFPSNQIIVNASKGIEVTSLQTLSSVINEVTFIDKKQIVALYGPTHAEEVATKIPTTIVSACKDINTSRLVQDIFSNSYFRVYANDDVIGVEVGGAIKNVIAIAAGITLGIGYGDNTISALITRGIAEIKRLGVKMGAKESTFIGLSGIGDLIVTATSTHSRNRTVGYQLGKGKKLNDIISEMGMIAEGVDTSRAIYNLSKKLNIEMPICINVYEILFNNKGPKNAITELMNRKLIDE